VERAALRLWRNPVWPVRRLAYSLDISERQLTRRFRALAGTTPKQFARIARIGKAVAAKRHGASWADIAYACGFNDQAHLVHDFRTMMRSPPDAFLSSPQCRQSNASLGASGFYNTFVV
jgi:transcriptional regulator GlxA family with amidase domain